MRKGGTGDDVDVNVHSMFARIAVVLALKVAQRGSTVSTAIPDTLCAQSLNEGSRV